MANELKASHPLFAVAAVAALRTARPRQEADALVVANGLDANSRAPRENADREGPVAHADSMGAVPDYRVKASSYLDHRRSRRTWGGSAMTTALRRL